MRILLFLPYFLTLLTTDNLYSLSSTSAERNDSINVEKKIYLQKNNTDSLSLKESYDNLYQLYQEEKYTEALNKALILARKTKNNTQLDFSTNLLIAEIFQNLNVRNKSISYYYKSLNILNSFESKNEFSSITSIPPESYAKVLIGLAGNYQLTNKIDSAKVYYKKIIQINSLNKEIQYIRAKAYSNLSGIYKKNNLLLAKEYTNKAIEIHRNNDNKISEASALNNLANIYLLEKNYTKAKEVYFKGLELLEMNNSIKATKFKEDLYFNLAYTLYLLKDYTAYDYQEKSYNIKDNLRDKEIRRMVEQIYTQHKENLEKEKTALVKEQRKLEEAQQAKTSLLFGALSFLVLIISGVIIYNYKLRQKNLHLKLSESKLIQQQSIEKLKSEAQIKILNATIDGKETERKLIAEILHDNVSALLSSANMHLTATKKQFNGDTPQEIDKTQAIISEASQKVRDLSHNLVSSILLKFGLEYAIKDVTKKYSNSELKFDVSAQNINRYNQEFEIKIFNVIQELINNILKHSKAQHAEIILKERKDQLTVLVKDDGVGFSTSSSSFSDGIGLNQIEARIQMMNGKLTINSKENIGTSIYISVPILKEQKDVKLTSVS
ncbi:sensor histidine kinase [uncultured Tenacibaculum sp.]|uniref:sensor histidine kinase n=1 Tax=uncultured Tenacibaculum sp. TaxID=174713 RepID=UPI00261C6839|nr:tetratricopeptide repeat-containing sensor histidine kinase [uncultured Tenacibaculum sp.]